MPDTFQYKVRDRAGNISSGSLVADSEALVLARLREQGFTPLDVKRQKKSIGQIEFGGKKVKLKQIAVFSRQFATMVNSGLPILRAIGILSDQSDNKELSRVLNETRLDVEHSAVHPGGSHREEAQHDEVQRAESLDAHREPAEEGRSRLPPGSRERPGLQHSHRRIQWRDVGRGRAGRRGRRGVRHVHPGERPLERALPDAIGPSRSRGARRARAVPRASAQASLRGCDP